MFWLYLEGSTMVYDSLIVFCFVLLFWRLLMVFVCFCDFVQCCHIRFRFVNLVWCEMMFGKLKRLYSTRIWRI